MIQKLGRYELLDKIGQGSFGTVYHARDTVLELERAIKILHGPLAADPEFIRRFSQEARLAARLNHVHLVPVYDLGEEQGFFFLVMDFLPGGSLDDWIKKGGKLSFADSVNVLDQVGKGLDFLHANGFVHRDIKPGNILFRSDPQGNPERAALLSDLGFAKAVETSSSAGMSSGGLVGTPAYIAPEIWEGKKVGPAADLYSLACVLVEMLTGQVLFRGDSNPAVMTRHVLEGPKLLETWPEGIPKGINQVLRKALAKEPTQRFSSAGELVKHLLALSQVVPQNDSGAKTVAWKRPDPPPIQVVIGNSPPPLPPYVHTAAKKRNNNIWFWIAGLLLFFGLIGSSVLGLGASWLVQNLVGSPMIPMITPSEKAIARASDSPSQTPRPTVNVPQSNNETIAPQTILAGNAAFKVTLYANQDWQNTGIYISSGETVTIKVVDGAWSSGISPSDNGSGSTYTCAHVNPYCLEPIPDVANGRLIGKIGFNLFDIGNENKITAAASGLLSLGINDDPSGLGDNSGSLSVLIDGGSNPLLRAETPTAAVTINANQTWQSTGLVINPGDVIFIKVASGKWTHQRADGSFEPSNGIGDPNYRCGTFATDCEKLIPGIPTGRLVGIVGPQGFDVGSGAAIQSRSTGTLFLAMNDDPRGLNDNAGFLSVEIFVKTAK